MYTYLESLLIVHGKRNLHVPAKYIVQEFTQSIYSSIISVQWLSNIMSKQTNHAESSKNVLHIILWYIISCHLI